MPNASEYARLEEEFNYQKEKLKTGIHSKSVKEEILRELQSVGKRLGITVPEYNSSAFSVFLVNEQI